MAWCRLKFQQFDPTLFHRIREFLCPNSQNLAPETLLFGAADQQDVQARVHELLLRMYPPGPPVERRHDRRYPYPNLVRLTPAGANGCVPAGPSVTVVGKNLSERGLGFFHTQPLPERRMIVSFDAGNGRWLGLLVDITWCRFICRRLVRKRRPLPAEPCRQSCRRPRLRHE